VAGSLLLNVQMFAKKARCMSEDAPELVVDGAVPSQPVVSPDGCWVAYVAAPAGRGEERCMCALWVAAADGSSPPWKLTAGTAADSDPRWAPDSASVFSRRGRRSGGRPTAAGTWPTWPCQNRMAATRHEPPGLSSRRTHSQLDQRHLGRPDRHRRIRALVRVGPDHYSRSPWQYP
jgi:hypothetical protein